MGPTQEEYDYKLAQVKTYEPFLRNLLTTIEVNLSNCAESSYDSNRSIRSHYEAQYHKVKGLYDIVSQKERSFSVCYATLEKCESIIISLKRRLRLGNDENGLNLFESPTPSAPSSPPPEDPMEQHRKSVPIIIPTERRDSTPSAHRDYNHASNPDIISTKLRYIRQQQAQQQANLMNKFDVPHNNAYGRSSQLSTALSKAPLSNDDLKDLLNETGAKEQETLIKKQAASAEAFDRVRQKFNQIVNTSDSSLSNQSRLAYKYNPHPKKIATDTSPPQMVRQAVDPRMDPRLRKPTYPNLNDPRVRNDHRQQQQPQQQPQPVPPPMSTYNVQSSGGNNHRMMMNMGLQNYHQMNMNPIGMAHHLHEPSIRDDMLHNQHHHLQHHIHQQQQQQQQTHQRMPVEPPMTPGIQSPSYGGINMFNFQMGSPMSVSRTEFQSPGIDPVLQFERQKYLDSRKRKSQDTGPRTYGEYKEAKRRAELEKLRMRSSEVESTKSSRWQTRSSVDKVRKSSSSQKQRDEKRIVSGDESNNDWDTETSSANTSRKENNKISTKNRSESNEDDWDAGDSGKMSVIEVPASDEECSKNCDTAISVSSEENWDNEENKTERIPNDVAECSKDEQQTDESPRETRKRNKSSSDGASSQETEDNSSLKRSKRTTRRSSNLRKTRKRNKSSSDGGSSPETEENSGLRRSKRTIRKPLHLAESDTDDQSPKKRKRQSSLRSSDQKESEAEHSQTDVPSVATVAAAVAVAAASSEHAEVKKCLPSTSVNRQTQVLEPTILKESNVIKEIKSTEEDTESKEREKEQKPDVEETKTKVTTRKSRKSKGTTQEKENSKTEGSEVVRNRVTRSKKKSELDRLQDDTREMFILQGGISHTGRRQCTLTKDEERGKEKSNRGSISDVQNKASDEIEEATDEVKEDDGTICDPSSSVTDTATLAAHNQQNGDVNDTSIATDDVDTSVAVDHVEEPKKPVQPAVKMPKKPSAPAQTRRRKRATKKGGKKSSSKIVDEPNNVVILRHEEDKIIFHEEEAVFDESNVDDMKDPLGISEDQNSRDSSVKVILTDEVPQVNLDFIEDTVEKEEDNQETNALNQLNNLALKNEIDSDLEREQDEPLPVDPPTLDSNAMWMDYNPSTYKNVDPNMHAHLPHGTLCIFCPFHGRYLANHYAQNHPDQEVIISRLPSSIISQLKNEVDVNVEQTITSSQGLQLLHKCVFCGISKAWSRIYWIEHYGTHTGEYTYTCSGCNRHSNMRAKLQKHVQECAAKSELIRNRKLINSAKTIDAYVCNLCNYIQMSDKNLNDHLARQHDAMEHGKTQIILLNNTKFVEPKTMKFNPPKSKRGRNKSQDYVIDVDAIDQTPNGSLNQEQMEAFIQPRDKELDLDQNMLQLMNEVSFSRAPPADYCNSVQEPVPEVSRKTSFIERLYAKVDDRKKQLQIENEVIPVVPVPAAAPPPKPVAVAVAERSDVTPVISDNDETKTQQKPRAEISMIDRLFRRFNKVVVPQKVDQPKRRISIVERFSTKFKDEDEDVQVTPDPPKSQSVAQDNVEVFAIVSDTDETSQSTGKLIPPSVEQSVEPSVEPSVGISSTSKETKETPDKVPNDNQNDEDNDEEWETIEVLPVVESCSQEPLTGVVNRLLTKLSKSFKKDKRFKFRKNSSEVAVKSRCEKSRDVRKPKTIEKVDVPTKVKAEEPEEDLVISISTNSQEYPEEASGEVQYIRTSVIKYINARGIAEDPERVSIEPEKMEVSDPVTFADDLGHKEVSDITEISEETNGLNNPISSRVFDNDRIDDKPINDQADQLNKPLMVRNLVGDTLSTCATLTIDDLKTKETIDFESNSDAEKDSDSDSDDQRLVIVTSSSDTSPNKPNKNDNNPCTLRPTVLYRAKKTIENIQALLRRESLYCFFKCMADNCSYATNIKSEMSQHLVMHRFNNQATSKSGQNFRPYQNLLDCCYCNKAYGMTEILQHITDVHNNEVFQCPYCFYRSVSDYNVIIHIRLHHPSQNEEILVCTCHMKTIDYEDTTLLKTRTQHHVRDIDCFECNETFHSIQCFADHLETGLHHNSDSYTCSICNDTINKHFVINHLLNTHKIGLYECINCYYATNDFDSIKPHIAERHPDTYPVICVRIPNVVSLQRMKNSYKIKSTQSPLLLHVKEPIDYELYKHCPHHNFTHKIPQKPKWSGQPLPMDLPTFLDIKNEIEHYLIKYEAKHAVKPKIPIKIDIDEYEVIEELICKYVSSTGLSYEELEICPILGCIESFENDEELLAHMQRHTRKKDKKNVINCVVCHEFITPDFKEYINHIKTHSRHRFFCYYCMTTRVSTFEMLDHMKEVHNDENLKVWPIIPNRRNDDKDFFIIAPMRTSPTLYLQHILYKLENIGQQWKLYYTPDELNNVPLPGVYSIAKFCLLCKYKTKVRTNLIRHLSHHKKEMNVGKVDPVNPVPCIYSTEKHFDKMTNLACSSIQSKQAKVEVETQIIHTLPKFVDKESLYKCGAEGCKYINYSYDMLRYHMNALHCEVENFCCPHCQIQLCKKKFSGDKVVKHLHLHDSMIYKCSSCAKYHYSKNVIERHIVEEHNSELAYMIEYNRSATSTTHTIRHVKPNNGRLNDSKSVWVCSICKMIVKTRNQIQKHMDTIHQISHQFKCNHCNETVQNISEHTLSKHKNMEINYKSYFNRIIQSKQIQSTTDYGDNLNQNTTPLWRRDPNKIKNIRGILMDEETTPVKLKTKSKSCTQVQIINNTVELSQPIKPIKILKTVQKPKKPGPKTNLIYSNKSRFCHECKCHCGSTESLINHLVSTHKYIIDKFTEFYTLYRFKCLDCDDSKSFKTYEEFNKHHNINHSKDDVTNELNETFTILKVYSCKLCKYVGTFDEITTHYKIRHKRKTFVYSDAANYTKCGFCDYKCHSISDVDSLDKHFLQMHPSPDKVHTTIPYKLIEMYSGNSNSFECVCTLCNTLLTSEFHVYNHDKLIHPNDTMQFNIETSNTYICPCCGQAFFLMEKLLEHVSLHLITVKCDECLFETNNAPDVYSHWDIHPFSLYRDQDIKLYQHINVFLQIKILFHSGLTILLANLNETDRDQFTRLHNCLAAIEERAKLNTNRINIDDISILNKTQYPLDIEASMSSCIFVPEPAVPETINHQQQESSVHYHHLHPSTSNADGINVYLPDETVVPYSDFQQNHDTNPVVTLNKMIV